MPPLLSIIITAHNGEAWLSATLDSVVESLGSALDQCEFVITNDNSSDSTQQIIDRFAAAYPVSKTFVTRFANIGKVRNFAIAHCEGEYILMVDGDDLLLPRKLEKICAFLHQQRPDLLISKLIEIAENETPPAQADFAPRQLSQDDAITRFLIHRDYQSHVIGQFFRRDILVAAPFPEFTCYEDGWVFPEVLTRSNKILYSSAGFYLYIKRSGSLSGSVNLNKVKCLFQTLEKMDRVLPARYSALIACHWIDLYNRYAEVLAGTAELEKTRQRIRSIDKLSFFCNRHIRLSYKRKLLKAARLAR